MAEVERVRTDGLQLDRVPAVGAARGLPVLFVHGLWAGAWLWERWMPVVAGRGRDAWAVELRGRGGSRHVPDVGRIRIGDLVRDVRDALDHIGPAVLVGHSMGGLVAQVVAAENPNVRAVALLCSVPPHGIVALTGPLLRQAGAYLPAMVRSRAFAPRRADADALIMNEVAPTERDALFPRFVPDSGTVAREIALGRVRVDSARVRVPVLVGGATHDRISPPAVHRRLVARYSSEELIFEGRGHLIMLEDGWRRRADLVLDWADRVTGGATGPAPDPPATTTAPDPPATVAAESSAGCWRWASGRGTLPRMLVAAIVVALALLVVAVSWGREMDETAHDASDAERVSGPRAA